MIGSSLSIKPDTSLSAVTRSGKALANSSLVGVLYNPYRRLELENNGESSPSMLSPSAESASSSATDTFNSLIYICTDVSVLSSFAVKDT